MEDLTTSAGQPRAPLPAPSPSQTGGRTAAAVRRTVREGLDLGLSMVVVHAVGEPRLEKTADGRWVQATDRRTGLPAVYGAKVPCGRWKVRQETPAQWQELEPKLTDRQYGP